MATKIKMTKAAAEHFWALADDLRRRLKSKPFRPFAVRLNNGRVLKVPARDIVFLPPEWSALIVTGPRTYFEFVPIVDVKEIVAGREQAKRSRNGKH